MGHEIKLGEALLELRELPDASVDLVITDPPYSSLEKWRDMGTTTRLKNSTQSSNEWFPTVSNEYLGEVFEQCWRILKNNTHLYVMCDEETGDVLKPILRSLGFNMRKSLIWHKVGKPVSHVCPKCDGLVETHSPGTPGMGYPFRSQWEMILLAEKGKRKPPADKSVRNVLQVPWIKNKNAYPTQKPYELLQILIRQSSFPGDLVLDPFAGSGSCGEAAYLEGRNFLGFDVKQKALDHFMARKSHWEFASSEDTPLPTQGSDILSFFQS
jgi:site-specific DNA-methyltransferase (adenine-specific)